MLNFCIEVVFIKKELRKVSISNMAHGPRKRIKTFPFAIFIGALACCCPCVLAFMTQDKLNESIVINLKQKIAKEEPIPPIKSWITSLLTFVFPCIGIALLRQQARERYQFAVS